MSLFLWSSRIPAVKGSAVAALLVLTTSAFAQTGALSKLGQVATAMAPVSRSTSEQVLPKEDVAQGLQEALVNGASEAVGLLGKTSGFANSPLYRIPLPPEAERLRTKIDANPVLKAAVGPQLEATVARMNEGAEKAVAKALPIFKRAILSMTFADAYGILRGGNRAATDYLIRTTGPTLRAAFKPEVDAALQEARVADYWTPAATRLNKSKVLLGMKEDLPADLTEYVLDKALDALFAEVALQEEKIRTQPAAQTTAVLQKVFGSLLPGK
jgi:hypothetical protein